MCPYTVPVLVFLIVHLVLTQHHRVPGHGYYISQLNLYYFIITMLKNTIAINIHTMHQEVTLHTKESLKTRLVAGC